MRTTSQLLAAVRSSRFLEPGTPTGLTGLLTSPAPRPYLIHTYLQTLQTLQKMPSTSIYRTSTEALTRHRLNIVKAQIPQGYEEWKARVNKIMADQEGEVAKYSKTIMRTPEGEPLVLDYYWGKKQKSEDVDERARKAEWDERIRTAERGSELPKTFQIEAEPPLTVDQIQEIESQISAGLVEEVLEVAASELKLAEQMLEDKPWEELMEQAPEGQWVYFTEGRAAHTKTQKP